MKNFGIFGCGVIANVHAMAIRSITGAKLVGCADVNMKAAATFADNYRIRYYDNLEHMLKDPEIDIVCVCTPNGTHAEIAIQILKADKHVIVEKPMATTTIDCDKMIEAANKSKGKIMVISQLRMSNSVVRAKEIIDNGQIGKIILCSLSMPYYRSEAYYHNSWRGTVKMDGGGALMNQGIHGVDLLQYMVGRAKKIKSIVKTLAHNIEVEDAAVCALEFESGAVGVIQATTAVNPGFDREIKIYGTNGCIFLRENKLEKVVIDGEEQACELFVSKGNANDAALVTEEEHAKQIRRFVRALEGMDYDYVDGPEGRKAVEIIERIYWAGREDRN